MSNEVKQLFGKLRHGLLKLCGLETVDNVRQENSAELEAQIAETAQQTSTSPNAMSVNTQPDVFLAENRTTAVIQEPGAVEGVNTEGHAIADENDPAQGQQKDNGITPKIVDVDYEEQQQEALLLNAELIESLKNTVDKAREFGMTMDKLRARRKVRTTFAVDSGVKRRRLGGLINSSPGDARHEKRRKRARVEDQALSRLFEEAEEEEQDYKTRFAENDMMASRALLQAARHLYPILRSRDIVPDIDEQIKPKAWPTASDLEYERKYEIASIAGSSSASDNGRDDAPIAETIPQRPTTEERAEQEYWQRLQDLQDAQERILEFDMRHYQRGQRLTRELIEAEERFVAAKQNAIDLGVQIVGDDRTSGFVDDERDGTFVDPRPPRERVDQSRFLAWAAVLPETMDVNNSARGFWDSLRYARGHAIESEEGPDLDDWDAGPPITAADSASVVAEGPGRRRIQRHQVATGNTLAATKAHWGSNNDRGLTAAEWDRGHRLFEIGR